MIDRETMEETAIYLMGVEGEERVVAAATARGDG